ncbi:MAG: hypothetical protein EOO07_17510, partial [Chitinophagaceae bacterium]
MIEKLLKKLIPSAFFFCGVFLLTCHSLFASECYHYHTSKKHGIIKTSNGIFYQFTEKDPNGLSYVQQVNKPIKGIDKNSYKAIGEDESTFMFSDKNGFYLLPKEGQYDGSIATYFKILPAKDGQRHINGRLFLINSKWTYFNAWGKDVVSVTLNELPANISNIKCYDNGLFVKDDKQVFAISIDLSASKKYIVQSVPNLNSAQLVYYACSPDQDEDFIADEKHIYSIRRDGSFEDITPQFLALHIKQKFNQLNLINNPITIWWTD